MKDMMNTMTCTLPTDKIFEMQTVFAGNNNQYTTTQKSKENNMSILKIWLIHRQRLIKAPLRKY